MAEERQALHAYVSDKSWAAWRHFSEENGVSTTGLLEALGLELAGEMETTDADELRQAWVKAGRKIDGIRRRRGGGR
jgi:hypothetical protein